MMIDEAGRANELILKLREIGGNPFLSDRIDTPFEERPSELHEFNRRAYEVIKREIVQVRDSTDKKCRGVLVLGEAGTGKTHLLSRIHQDLGSENHMLFVPRPSNPDGVVSFIWSKVLESLDKPKTSESRATQGDILLREAFRSILQKSVERDPRLAAEESQYEWSVVISRVSRGELLGNDLERVRNRIISYYRDNHHAHSLHAHILRALINYVFYSDRIKRQEVFECLNNFEVDEETAKNVGLQAWKSFTEEATRNDVVSGREEWALEALRVVSTLGTYGLPLILAFDQLEGMRNRPELTQEWGKAIQEIMTHCHNLVVVCCIFPSLWKNWFCKPLEDGYSPLEEAVIHRIAATQIELDTLSFDSAKKLVRERLLSFQRKNDLPDSAATILTDDALMQIWQSLDGTSARRLIQRCKSLYDSIVGQGSSASPKRDEPSDVIDRKIQQALASTASVENDGEWVGRLKELLEVTQKVVSNEALHLLQRKTWGKKVVPEHVCLRIRDASGSRVAVIAYCNLRGISLSARLRNWRAMAETEPNSTFVFLRREDCPRPSPSSSSAQSMRALGRGFRELLKRADAYISACHAAFIAVEEQELRVEERLITLDDFAHFMATTGLPNIFESVGIKWAQTTNRPATHVVEYPGELQPILHQATAKVAEAKQIITITGERVEFVKPVGTAEAISTQEGEVEDSVATLRRFVREYDWPDIVGPGRWNGPRRWFSSRSPCRPPILRGVEFMKEGAERRIFRAHLRVLTVLCTQPLLIRQRDVRCRQERSPEAE